jgi:hypothetical protein
MDSTHTGKFFVCQDWIKNQWVREEEKNGWRNTVHNTVLREWILRLLCLREHPGEDRITGILSPMTSRHRVIRQCPRRDARGRPPHPGGPADGLPPRGVGPGYRGRDGRRATTPAVYALIDDEDQRDRLGPVCGAGDCQSPWGHGRRHEYARRRDDLYSTASSGRCGCAAHPITIANSLARAPMPFQTYRENKEP